MQPYGLLSHNLNYGAEPLLDGGQFGAGKDNTQVELDYGDMTQEQYNEGIRRMHELGFNMQLIQPKGNPFGSGQGGPVVYLSKFFAWLVNHPEEQKALLHYSRAPPQDVVNFWASQGPKYSQLILLRLIAALGKASLA